MRQQEKLRKGGTKPKSAAPIMDAATVAAMKAAQAAQAAKAAQAAQAHPAAGAAPAPVASGAVGGGAKPVSLSMKPLTKKAKVSKPKPKPAASFCVDD